MPIGALTKRMDAFEKKDDDDNDIEEDDAMPADGTPKALAADSREAAFKWRKKMDKIGEAVCDSVTQDLFSTFQARADRVYGMHGMQATKPLSGETLNSYRRRLLIPFLQHSPAFKHSDLRVLAVDPAGFKHAEDVIYTDAAKAASDPRTVPLGYLREQVEQRGGHTYTKFIGNPKSWMNAFAHPGKRVKQIVERSDSGGPHRTLYEAKY